MSLAEPHIVSSPNEHRLDKPPADCISDLRFSPDPSQPRSLLASSWDSGVYVYDAGTAGKNHMQVKYSHDGPVLCATFMSPTQIASGGLDGTIKSFNMTTGVDQSLGAHEKGTRCIEYSQQNGALLTGSGTAPRCIRAFPTGRGYVLSSIEGRVSVEYMSPDQETQKQKYAFKCHRAKEDGTEVIYPVNAIAFHPTHNTFATGGSDALVNIWDPFNKKRLCQFHKYPTSVSALAFNSDGSLLAIGSSFLHESKIEDGKMTPSDAIFIRRVADQEARPKS